MLVMLSGADGVFSPEEKEIINEYIKANFSLPVDLDQEDKILETLPAELYMEHFRKVANDFFWDSSEKERMVFLNFAFQLLQADQKITREENLYIDALYEQWDYSPEEY